jgi:hypothetical protein
MPPGEVRVSTRWAALGRASTPGPFGDPARRAFGEFLRVIQLTRFTRPCAPAPQESDSTRPSLRSSS